MFHRARTSCRLRRLLAIDVQPSRSQSRTQRALAAHVNQAVPSASKTDSLAHEAGALRLRYPLRSDYGAEQYRLSTRDQLVQSCCAALKLRGNVARPEVTLLEFQRCCPERGRILFRNKQEVAAFGVAINEAGGSAKFRRPLQIDGNPLPRHVLHGYAATRRPSAGQPRHIVGQPDEVEASRHPSWNPLNPPGNVGPVVVQGRGNIIESGPAEAILLERHFRDDGAFRAPFRTEQPSANLLGMQSDARTPKREPVPTPRNLERRTTFASSSTNHSLWVVTITRIPAPTSLASRRVNSTCMGRVQVRLRFFDDQHVTRLDDVLEIEHDGCKLRNHGRSVRERDVGGPAVGAVGEVGVVGRRRSIQPDGSLQDSRLDLLSEVPASRRSSAAGWLVDADEALKELCENPRQHRRSCRRSHFRSGRARDQGSDHRSVGMHDARAARGKIVGRTVQRSDGSRKDQVTEGPQQVKGIGIADGRGPPPFRRGRSPPSL